MSLFNKLLTEQVNLLKEKGYNEAGLNSPVKEGYLATTLRQKFSRALSFCMFNNEIESFSIQTDGFFNDDRDIVTFQFDYEFDVSKDSLEIKKLHLASTYNNSRVIEISNRNDLPHSSEALSLLGLDKKNVPDPKHRHVAPENKNNKGIK